MKIKRDFVTNSSSASFVFCVPKDFDVKEYILKHTTEEDFDDLENLKEAIDLFASGGVLCEYEYGDEINFIQELFKDFEIYGVDVGPDRTSIALLYLEDIQDKVLEKAKEHENKDRLCH